MTKFRRPVAIWRVHTYTVISITNRSQTRRHLVDDIAVAQVPCRCDDHATRPITQAEKLHEVFAAEAVHRRGGAANRPADGMIAKKVQAEKIVHVVIRRIIRLGNLLQDDGELALDFFLLKVLM